MKKNDKEKSKNNTSSKKRANLIYGLSMSLLVVIFSITILHQYRIKLDLDAKYASLQAEITKENSTKESLQKLQENQDSPEFVEKIAREKLNMVKPNEIVFIDQNK